MCNLTSNCYQVSRPLPKPTQDLGTRWMPALLWPPKTTRLLGDYRPKTTEEPRLPPPPTQTLKTRSPSLWPTGTRHPSTKTPTPPPTQLKTTQLPLATLWLKHRTILTATSRIHPLTARHTTFAVRNPMLHRLTALHTNCTAPSQWSRRSSSSTSTLCTTDSPPTL